MDAPHEILGVDPDADDDDIREAYRRRVVETHPDQGGSLEEFQRVRAAYDAVQAGEELQPSDVDAAATSVDDQPEAVETTVEYLNYAVLDDHGWALDDADLFAKADRADLDAVDHGEFTVDPGETLLEAAENRGFAWPYACRGGACANCAVAVTDGDLSQPVDHILSEDMTDRGFRLSCNGVPVSDHLRVVFNVKHLPGLDELRLPPYPFELAHADD
ncbi:MAG: ferredoxin Fer [Halobacterium sp.]